MLFSGYPQHRFNRHQNKIFLDIDWSRDATLGEYVVIECYRKLEPDTVTLTGTFTSTNTSNLITGTGTTIDQQIIEGDIITVGGQDAQVNRIISPTQAFLTANLATSVTGVTATKTGVSDVWNDRFLKQYATALIKYQWGSNLSKFAGVQMPGGVTLDGPRIMQEAQVEIDKIETEMQAYNVLPPEILTG